MDQEAIAVLTRLIKHLCYTCIHNSLIIQITVRDASESLLSLKTVNTYHNIHFFGFQILSIFFLSFSPAEFYEYAALPAHSLRPRKR